MIDLSALISSALAAAVAEATKPLLERIEKLEMQSGDRHERLLVLEGALTDRVIALENNPATGETLSPDDLVQVKQRIEALEQATPETPETPAAISAAAFVTYLDQQEWFWEKLNRKAGEAAQAVAEEAINDHCSTYDHDDYDNVACLVNDANLDDMVTMDNLRDEIKQVLRDATVSIDV